jgi:hypothetical protein
MAKESWWIVDFFKVPAHGESKIGQNLALIPKASPLSF